MKTQLSKLAARSSVGTFVGALLVAAPVHAQDAEDYQVVRLVDTVVSNTDPMLTVTDTFDDWENSLAINPADPNEIVVLGFSGTDPTTGNAAIWYSSDGGMTWTKMFAIPQPPGYFVPNDQTLDWGRNDELSFTFLTSDGNIMSVVTTDPTDSTAYTYLLDGGGTAVTTNVNNPGSAFGSDQPWLIVNRDPLNLLQDNVYVGYDDFNNSDGIDGPDMRVAVSYGSNPLDFTVDVQVGNSLGFVNPGLRLFKDIGSGAVYAMWGRSIVDTDPRNMNYMLNRSTDGGLTWQLDGDPMGVAIANAPSTQPWPKFAEVNALLGGAHHAATDPNDGAIYYVYGNQDAMGNDRMAIRRVTVDAAGVVTIGDEHFVTLLDAALPQVAVDDEGTVAVFYYSYDGFSGPPNDLPLLTAHIAISDDQGETFVDTPLVTFESPDPPSGDLFDRQRVLGDYENLKVIGTTFYGAFTANGAAFGRAFDNGDPIYFQVELQEGPEFCLLAEETLVVADRGDVTAITGAGTSFELGNDASLTGDTFVDGGAFFRHRATVDGDLTLAGTLQNQGVFTITGTLTENADVEVPGLPERAVSPGAGSLFVPHGTFFMFGPGNYGNVTLGARATVVFAPGTYNFASLQVEPDVRMTIEGEAELNVQGQFTLGDRSTCVTNAGAEALLVYSNGAVRLGNDTLFEGRLMAPQGTLDISSRADVFGCLGASRIAMQPDVFIDGTGAALPL